MTRGKYAAKSANKAVREEADATEAGYRRQIVRLTEERNQARGERDKALDDWSKEVRILRAQLAEGTSPRIEALSRELNRLRGERDELRQGRATRRSRNDDAFKRLMDHMEFEHGMSRPAALDATASLFLGVDDAVVTVGIEKRTGEMFGPETVLALRKARGQ